MDHWNNISPDEKIERLANAVYNLSKQLDKLMRHTNADIMPGHEILRLEMTDELADHWLGVCPWCRKKVA